MHQGFIKLHRKLLEWDWYDDPNTFRLFIHLLLKANHSNKSWRGIEIKRGDILTSLESLSKELGLSYQQVRTSIKKLISTNEITNKSTSSSRVITVNSYNIYQDSNRQDNSQATSEQQTSNKQATTTKECKNAFNEKNEKKITDSELLKEKQKYKDWFNYNPDASSNMKLDMEDKWLKVKAELKKRGIK